MFTILIWWYISNFKINIKFSWKTFYNRNYRINSLKLICTKQILKYVLIYYKLIYENKGLILINIYIIDQLIQKISSNSIKIFYISSYKI